MTPEELAQAFHEAYERLAPSFGYETRKASAVPWAEVPEQNRRLMVAVAGEVLGNRLAALERENVDLRDELRLLRLATGSRADRAALRREALAPPVEGVPAQEGEAQK